MTNSLDKLTLTTIDALEDIKGQNIMVFDAQPLTSMFDRVVVVSGTSNRQTRALAKNLHDKVKQAGFDVYGAEGEDTGEWVLVDLGDIVVHIMQPEIRDYYRLEEIWGKHPLDVEAIKAAGKKPAPKRKPTAKKPLTGTTATKKSETKATTKTPVEKATAKSKSGSKPTATKKSATKSNTASKTPASKKPATKTTSKKPASKKPAAKSAGAKTPTAKKPAPKKPAKK